MRRPGRELEPSTDRAWTSPATSDLSGGDSSRRTADGAPLDVPDDLTLDAPATSRVIGRRAEPIGSDLDVEEMALDLERR